MSIPSPVQDPLVSANLLVAFAHASAVPRFSHVSWALTRVECFTTSFFLTLRIAVSLISSLFGWRAHSTVQVVYQVYRSAPLG
jgi:hypothetical protein